MALALPSPSPLKRPLVRRTMTLSSYFSPLCSAGPLTQSPGPSALRNLHVRAEWQKDGSIRTFTVGVSLNRCRASANRQTLRFEFRISSQLLVLPGRLQAHAILRYSGPRDFPVLAAVRKERRLQGIARLLQGGEDLVRSSELWPSFVHCACCALPSLGHHATSGWPPGSNKKLRKATGYCDTEWGWAAMCSVRSARQCQRLSGEDRTWPTSILVTAMHPCRSQPKRQGHEKHHAGQEQCNKGGDRNQDLQSHVAFATYTLQHS